MAAKPRVSLVGGSGYVGGELLRLLSGHPSLLLGQVTSERHRGERVDSVHPHLRGMTEAAFVSSQDLTACDLLILALPHGEAGVRWEEFSPLAERIIDLSADHRLRDSGEYLRWYGREHPLPSRLEKFVYGIPELYRERLPEARWVTGAGCNATAVILALLPLVESGWAEQRIVTEVKCGSSEGGRFPTESSHHPERRHCLRSFKATGHRHSAEILQELGLSEISLSVTAVDEVRGILTTSHLFLKESRSEGELFRLYRERYSKEPFVRIVRERKGHYRFPEPKLLWGTNFCDVGFERDPRSSRVVVVSAMDNLMKGAAGQGVQCLNIMMGFPEETALGFRGLHPV